MRLSRRSYTSSITLAKDSKSVVFGEDVSETHPTRRPVGASANVLRVDRRCSLEASFGKPSPGR